MLSLRESLFDKNLTSSELNIEKLIKKFDSDSLQELSVEQRNALFDTIFNLGSKYNKSQLKDRLINLKQNLLIIRIDNNLRNDDDPRYTERYVFIFKNEEHMETFTLMPCMNYTRYYWDQGLWDQDLSISKSTNYDENYNEIFDIIRFYKKFNIAISVITNKKIIDPVVRGLILG